MTDGQPTRAQQRLIGIAILLGALLFAIVVPFLLPGDGGGIAGEPVEMLDQLALGVGVLMLVMSMVMRRVLLARAASAPAESAGAAAFAALLVPLAMLESGMLFSCVAWLVNGKTMPHAAVFAVLFVRALLMVPFGDDDARS